MNDDFSQEKVCTGCGKSLSLSAFYLRPNGTPYRRCKACHRTSSATARTERSIDLPRKETGSWAEHKLVELLACEGIPAVVQGAGDFTDVVVWGCVNVEVKSSNPRKSRNNSSSYYVWSFSDEQIIQPLDVIVLVCLDRETFHIIDANEPILLENAHRKKTLIYQQDAKWRHKRTSEFMHLIDTSLNAWHVIEMKRISISDQLKARSRIL